MHALRKELDFENRKIYKEHPMPYSFNKRQLFDKLRSYSGLILEATPDEEETCTLFLKSDNRTATVMVKMISNMIEIMSNFQKVLMVK